MGGPHEADHDDFGEIEFKTHAIRRIAYTHPAR